MNNKNNGFTMVEILIFLVLLFLILSLGYNLLSFGNKTLVESGNRFQLQSDLRNASDFITEETRNATAIDVISIPFTAQTGYSYIYLQGSKIVYQYNGTTIEKTGAIINDQNIFTIIKDSNNINFLALDLDGTLDGKSYSLSTNILLNNIFNKAGQTGKAIGYIKP